MIANSEGAPVEFVLAPGSWHDVNVFKRFDLDLPEGSSLFADSAYTDYEQEDLMSDALNVSLFADRKSDSKRPNIPAMKYLISTKRKRAETNFSILTGMFPKSIHAITARGFELKVVCFIFAYAMTFLV